MVIVGGGVVILREMVVVGRGSGHCGREVVIVGGGVVIVGGEWSLWEGSGYLYHPPQHLRL